MLFKNMYRISFETNTGLFWELHRALLRQIEDSFGMSTRFFRDIYRASERCAGLFGDIHSALLRCAQGSCETRGSFGTGKGLFLLFWDMHRAFWRHIQGSLHSFERCAGLFWDIHSALLGYVQGSFETQGSLHCFEMCAQLF